MENIKPAEPPPPRASPLRRLVANFWLRIFFCLAERAPRIMQSAACHLSNGAFHFSPSIRRGTLANARRILGPHSSADSREQLAHGVVRSFYLFCCDVARSMGAKPQDLLDRIEWVAGHDAYLRARAGGNGVIVVTAHMGSFEVGMAALRAMEPHIHVVFRRDPVGQFERRRSQLRRRLGVSEAALDEGWTLWIRLRDALLANHAVVLQGDRVLPGQRGQRVPFLGGHLELPTGPVKLALATGAPILPVFTIRMPGGGIRLFVEDPIIVSSSRSTDSADPDAVDLALLKFKNILEKYVKAYPQQWLILEPAWIEDREST